jgi:Skp family chaperone for outer membrane proteins
MLRTSNVTKLLSSGLVIAAIGMTSSAIAEDSASIATVDINKIMNQMDEAKDMKARLDSATASAKRDIESKRAELAKIEGSLRDRKINPASEEGDKFRAKVKDFERLVRDNEEKLRRDFLKTNNELSAKVLKAVEEYAADNEIDLVLEKNGEGRGAVLYGQNSADITDAILENLN